jgi:hypothetical protein
LGLLVDVPASKDDIIVVTDQFFKIKR